MAFFMLSQRGNLPQALTSYDLLKTLAVVLMVVDHVGYIFFPDIVWFRVVGRLSVPIWFFLIGFARMRDVPSLLWAGGGLVLFSSMAAGEHIFPLNILFTLGLTRLMIDGVMVRALRSYETFVGMFFVLFFSVLPSLLFFEYGTLGLMFAMFGYMRRNRDIIVMKPIAVFGFIFAIGFVYAVSQSLLFKAIDGPQFGVLVCGIAILSVILYVFKPATFSGVYDKIPGLCKILKFTGRYTLEIYVVHLLVLRGVAMALYPERFQAFGFEIMPGSMRNVLVAFFAG